MDIRNWQISAGALAELVRPFGFALAALLSTWVLYDARRRRFRTLAAYACALLCLLLPPVVLPLYFIARSFNYRPTEEKLRWRFALPLLYSVVLAVCAGCYFYLDARSRDAHLARAGQARLLNRREQAILEYRRALALEDDPHTRKLLGVELAQAGRAEEALAEFLIAERGGEPDELLSFRIASALDALNRPAEAAPVYQKFLQSRACTQPLPERDCEQAHARLQQSNAIAPAR